VANLVAGAVFHLHRTGRTFGHPRLAGVASNQVAIEEHGPALIAQSGDGIIGQWESKAALTADVAAAIKLKEENVVFNDLNPAETIHLLRSLRVFVDSCPECGGSIQVEQEVIDSCCNSYDVIISACQECDAPLFEIEWEDDVTVANS
jgi:hypothetical protein